MESKVTSQVIEGDSAMGDLVEVRQSASPKPIKMEPFPEVVQTSFADYVQRLEKWGLSTTALSPIERIVKDYHQWLLLAREIPAADSKRAPEKTKDAVAASPSSSPSLAQPLMGETSQTCPQTTSQSMTVQHQEEKDKSKDDKQDEDDDDDEMPPLVPADVPIIPTLSCEASLQECKTDDAKAHQTKQDEQTPSADAFPFQELQRVLSLPENRETKEFKTRGDANKFLDSLFAVESTRVLGASCAFVDNTPFELKRVPSPYFLFVRDKRPEVKKEHPEWSPIEIMTELSQRWKMLGEGGQAPYRQQFKEACPWSEVQTRFQHHRDVRSAAMLFTLAKRAEVKKEYPNWRFGEITRELHRRWRNLGESGQAPYLAFAQEKFAELKKKHPEWRPSFIMKEMVRCFNILFEKGQPPQQMLQPRAELQDVPDKQKPGESKEGEDGGGAKATQDLDKQIEVLQYLYGFDHSVDWDRAAQAIAALPKPVRPEYEALLLAERGDWRDWYLKSESVSNEFERLFSEVDSSSDVHTYPRSVPKSSAVKLPLEAMVRAAFVHLTRSGPMSIDCLTDEHSTSTLLSHLQNVCQLGSCRESRALAQMWLGWCYHVGFGVNDSPTQAARLWLEAARAGCARAMFWYAMYVPSIPTETRDKWMRTAADAHFPPAQNVVAMRDAKVDKISALEDAARAGYPVAKFNLASALKQKDAVRATTLFKEAATAGYPAAVLVVAATMSKQDATEAARLLLRVAAGTVKDETCRADMAMCCFRLAMLLKTETMPTLKTRPDATLHYLRKAAALENDEAAHELGTSLLQSSSASASSPNRIEALHWLRQAANRGHAPSQFALAYDMHYRPDGLLRRDAYKHHPEMFRLLSAAALQGHVAAKVFLGEMYEFSYGPANLDKARAVSLYKEAVMFPTARLANHDQTSSELLTPEEKMGVAWGHFYLGWCYEAGTTGVPQNFQDSVRLYTVAARMGNVRAMAHLGNMAARGAGMPKDLDVAISWSKQAADGGFAPALKDLSFLYSLKSTECSEMYDKRVVAAC